MTDKSEKKELSEESLQTVDGGNTAISMQCKFIPAKPVETKWVEGRLWARCGSGFASCYAILSNCACFRSDRCVDSFHIMSQPKEIPGEILSPVPVGMYNHEVNDKIIIYNP